MSETMKYKGYVGSVEYSKTDDIFFGKVQGIDEQVYYEGRTRKDLIVDFNRAVDNYLKKNI